MPRPALGLIETEGIDGAIEASRAAAGAGSVVIVSAEKSVAGRLTVKIEGDWSAVQVAVEAGARAAERAGQFVSMHLIPKTEQDVNQILPYKRFVDRYRTGYHEASRRNNSPTKTRPRKSSVARPVPPKSVSEPAPTTQVVADSNEVQTVTPKIVRPVVETEKPKSETIAEDFEMSWETLQALAVVKLRKYARSISELPIKGRQISKANKEQLLEAIASVRKGKQ